MDALSSIAHPASEVLFAALILAILAWQITGGSALTSSTLVCLLLLFRLQPNLTQVSDGCTALAGLAGSVRSVERLLAAEKELSAQPGAIAYRPPSRAITFTNVSFCYENGAPAVDSVTCTIPAGRVTAIVGESGGGKTTLAHLLCRFYDPVAGRIAVDDRDLSAIDRHEWRRHVALVGQDAHLFSTTVGENIRIGRERSTPEEIVSSAVAAQVHEFICDLPAGYESEVGERGLRLSGGQRQRIALARALVRDSDLLILDEATNALDALTEDAVLRSIRERKAGQTILIIAHRLSTVIDADHVLVLQKGRLVESGPPAKLLQSQGVFSALYRTRRLDEALVSS
jgi:subfamily B ATP-binding cassette protein MsbA